MNDNNFAAPLLLIEALHRKAREASAAGEFDLALRFLAALGSAVQRAEMALMTERERRAMLEQRGDE